MIPLGVYHRRFQPLLAIILGTCLLGACLWWIRPWTMGQSPGLRILATDELADMGALVKQFTKTTGIDATVDYVPLAQVIQEASAPQFARRYDALWVPTNGMRPLPENIERQLGGGKTIMSSPIVLGLRPGVKAHLVAAGSDVTWQTLAKTAGPDGFTFGMVEPRTVAAPPSPSASASGIPSPAVTPTAPWVSQPAGSAAIDEADAALLSMVTGLAQASGAIISQEVYQASPQLRALRTGQVLRPGTARELTEQFLQPNTVGVSGIVTHESEILRINATVTKDISLDVVVPDGRTVFTRYPLRPLLTSRATARTGMQQLLTYLMNGSSQRWIETRTYRRAGSTDNTATVGRFPPVREVDTPRSTEVLDQLVNVYLDMYHYPTRVVFVLDISESMRGQGIQELRQAFASLNKTIATAHGINVEVLLIPFSTEPAQQVTSIQVMATAPEDGLAKISAVVAALTPGGSTGLYKALIKADNEIAARSTSGQENVTSIILITDGENTEQTTLQDFRDNRTAMEHDRCAQRTLERCRVPVFPILVGDASEEQMRQVAAATGGQVHDARNADLGQVLRDLTAGR